MFPNGCFYWSDVSLSLQQRNSVNVSDKFKSRCKFHESQVSLLLLVSLEMLDLSTEVQLLTPLFKCSTFRISGLPLEAGALTVDLEAASRAFDQLMARPWIRQSVRNIL